MNWKRLRYFFPLISLLLLTVSLPVGAENVPVPAPFEPATQAANTYRVNAPYFSGDVAWERTAIFWFGQNKQGAPSQNYVDVRVGYNSSALQIWVNDVDYYLWYDENATTSSDLTPYEAVAFYLDTTHDRAATPQSDDYWLLTGARFGQDARNYIRQARGNGSSWNTAWTPSTAWSVQSSMAWSCNPGPNSNACGIDFGWKVILTIPWATLGLSSRPADGTVWGLGVRLYDRDDAPPNGYVAPEHWPEGLSTTAPVTWGELVFNPPAYEPPPAVVEGATTIRRGLNGVVEDAWLGGGGLCAGGHMGGSEINHGDSGDLFTGSETTISHFPCYNKSYLRFYLDDIPPDRIIVSATLTLHLWGNAGAPGEAQPSWVHLYNVTEPWTESTIHWNNAPVPRQNIAVTQVNPCTEPEIVWPGNPYTWDATQAVAEAYAAGQPLSVALYASDTAQHSSKYYVGSESTITNGRPSLTVTWGRAVADLTKTAVPGFGNQDDQITYNLNFLGTGYTLALTDTLPAGVSGFGNLEWDGTGVAPVYDGGQHRLTWSDTPALGQEVNIRYTVTINTGDRQALINTAKLSEAGGLSDIATAAVIANPHLSYMPLIFKEW